MKVILAHPGQQHSFKVAQALKQSGLLYKYMTCVYDTDRSWVMKFVHLIVKGRDVSRLANRKCDSLSEDDIEISYTFLSLVVIVFSKFRRLKKFSYWLDRKISDHFGVRVAKYAIKHQVDAVICFSMNESKCFTYLSKHAPHIKRIVDCANSPVAYMKHIYEEDMRQTGICVLRKEVPSFWDHKEQQKQGQGIKLTQYFLAPSNFVKHGLMYCGVNSASIYILHYGSNFTPLEDRTISSDKGLKCVYVGQVTYRKGLHYLLKVFSDIHRDDISLDVVGAWKPDSDLYEKYKNVPSIRFLGNQLHSEVKKYLMNADVFVFSSLTEGFSLSCLEALSCGLPVICSKNSGVNDLITNGENGFTFEYNDVNSLKNHIFSMADNKSLLTEMSKKALETAKKNTWSAYNKNFNAIVSAILEK